jgi:hypothetical protein
MPKGKPFGDSSNGTKWEAIDLTQQPATRRLLNDDELTLQSVNSWSGDGGERGDNRWYHRTFYGIIKRALDDERRSLGVAEANLAIDRAEAAGLVTWLEEAIGGTPHTCEWLLSELLSLFVERSGSIGDATAAAKDALRRACTALKVEWTEPAADSR